MTTPSTVGDLQTAVGEVRRALEDGPTPGPWRATEFNEARTGDFIPSFTALPIGRFHRDPTVDAAYIAACNPSNITIILDELASLIAERDELRKAEQEQSVTEFALESMQNKLMLLLDEYHAALVGLRFLVGAMPVDLGAERFSAVMEACRAADLLIAKAPRETSDVLTSECLGVATPIDGSQR